MVSESGVPRAHSTVTDASGSVVLGYVVQGGLSLVRGRGAAQALVSVVRLVESARSAKVLISSADSPKTLTASVQILPYAWS